MAAGHTLDTEPTPGPLAGLQDAQAGSRARDGDQPGRRRTWCTPSANPRSILPGADTATSPGRGGMAGARGGGPRCPLRSSRASSAPRGRAGAELAPWAPTSGLAVTRLPRLAVSGTACDQAPGSPVSPSLGSAFGVVGPGTTLSPVGTLPDHCHRIPRPPLQALPPWG